jgi:hypothetical protein
VPSWRLVRDLLGVVAPRATLVIGGPIDRIRGGTAPQRRSLGSRAPAGSPPADEEIVTWLRDDRRRVQDLLRSGGIGCPYLSGQQAGRARSDRPLSRRACPAHWVVGLSRRFADVMMMSLVRGGDEQGG